MMMYQIGLYYYNELKSYFDHVTSVFLPVHYTDTICLVQSMTASEQLPVASCRQ